MPRELPHPTDKSQKKKKKKHIEHHQNPGPRVGMTTVQTAGVLGVSGASAFGFMRWWFGDLWLKELARKAFEWIYPLFYPEIEWWQVFRRVTYWGLRSHFQQHGPTYFIYFASAVLTVLPGGFFVWRKVIKPRFCKTDPVTDQCINEDENCEEGCDEDESRLDDDDVLFCEKQKQLIEGQVVEVQVCLTPAAREAIEASKKKREEEAEKLRKEQQGHAVSVIPDRTPLDLQNTASSDKAKDFSAELSKRKKKSVEAKTAKRPKIEKEETPPHASGEEVVMVQSGEDIDLKEKCDCEEEEALALHKTLLTMADATPTGSKFKGKSKQRNVQTRKSSKAMDTQACEHKMDVEVTENGEQTNDTSRGYLWTRLFK